jgi:hypothetical protein
VHLLPSDRQHTRLRISNTNALAGLARRSALVTRARGFPRVVTRALVTRVLVTCHALGFPRPPPSHVACSAAAVGSSLCFLDVPAGFSPLARMHTHFFVLPHFRTRWGPT